MEPSELPKVPDIELRRVKEGFMVVVESNHVLVDSDSHQVLGAPTTRTSGVLFTLAPAIFNWMVKMIDLTIIDTDGPTPTATDLIQRAREMQHMTREGLAILEEFVSATCNCDDCREKFAVTSKTAITEFVQKARLGLPTDGKGGVQ